MAYVKPKNVTDYAAEIQKATKAGASAQTVAELQAARQAKIKADSSLAKWNTDDFNKTTNSYIAQNLPQTNYQSLGTFNDSTASTQAKQAITEQQDIWKTYNALANAAADPSLKQEYTAQRDQAHTAAEQVRSGLGYSGGQDGSDYIPTAPALQQKPQFDMTQATAVQPPQFNGAPSGLLDGYINFNYDDIKGIFEDSTKAQYEMLNKQFQQTENKFYDSMFDAQNATTDMLRRNRNSAVATGASTGIQAANELLATLGFGQQTVAGATQLGQDRNILKEKEAAAMAQVPSNALNTANQAGATAAGIASNVYAADTQFSVGQMDAVARYQQALKELEGVIYNADKSYAGTVYNANKNYAGTTEAAKANAAAYQNNQGGSGANAPGTVDPKSMALDDVVARKDFTAWKQLYNKDKGVTDDAAIQKEWAQMMVNQKFQHGLELQNTLGKAGLYMVEPTEYNNDMSFKDIKKAFSLSDKAYEVYNHLGARFVVDTKPVGERKKAEEEKAPDGRVVQPGSGGNRSPIGGSYNDMIPDYIKK